MEKISVLGATLLAAAVLCAAPISLHQSLSLSVDKAQARCRATANTRERCWRPPQASQALCAMEWHRLRSLLLRRRRASTRTAIQAVRPWPLSPPWPLLTIIGATLITAIAIGETYRFVAASKLVIRIGARAAAHAAAFSLSALNTYARLPHQAELIRHFR